MNTERVRSEKLKMKSEKFKMESGELRMENKFVKVKLGDVVIKEKSGKYGIPAKAITPTTEQFLRYLRISDINDDGSLNKYDLKTLEEDAIDEYFLEENDIVIARTGNSTGRTYVYNKKDGKLVYAGFLIKYHLDEKKIDKEYIKAYFRSSMYKQWIKNLSVGSTRGNINAQTFYQCPILLPSLKTQKKIARVLSVIDEKIEVNKKINEKLEAMARDLYEYYFVQFDFPNEDGKPYKSSGGEMVYSKELKREIPKGWEVVSLNEYFEIDSGYPFESKDFKNNGKFGVVTIQNVQNQMLNANNIKFVEFLPKKISKTSILKIGDILISLTGDVGRVCFVNREHLLLNQRVGHIYSNVYSDNLIYYLFSSKYITEKSKQIATGSNQKNLSPESLLNILIPYNKKIFKLFEDETKSIFQMLIQNQLQIQKLESLRDFLLPMLLNGQVEVKD